MIFLSPCVGFARGPSGAEKNTGQRQADRSGRIVGGEGIERRGDLTDWDDEDAAVFLPAIDGCCT